MKSHPEWWLISFLCSAVLLIVLEMWRGWRAGGSRHAINLTALLVAYPTGIWMGRSSMRFFSQYDLLVSFLGCFVIGMVVFLTLLTGIRRGLRGFSPPDAKAIGLKQNFSGLALGGLFGLLLVWLMTIGIRVLGTIAENYIIPTPSHTVADARVPASMQPTSDSGGLISGLSALKESLGHGAIGRVMDRVDPMPTQTYTVLAKITRIIVDPNLVERFMTYPGAKTLAEHPKMIALRDDPEIQRVVLSKNIVSLLTNERVTAAVNDPELSDLVQKFELEKALDFALHPDHPVN